MTRNTLSGKMGDIIGITGGKCNTCLWRKRLSEFDEKALRKYQSRVYIHYKRYKDIKWKARTFSAPKKKHYCAKESIKKDNCGSYELSGIIKARLVALALVSQFPKTVHGNLMLQIILQSVRDLYDDEQKMSHYYAKVFLSGVMPQAEICGVDSKWVTKVVQGCGVDLTITQDDIEIVDRKINELNDVAKGLKASLKGLRKASKGKEKASIRLDKVNARISGLLIEKMANATMQFNTG